MRSKVKYLFSSYDILSTKSALWLKRFTNVSQQILGGYSSEMHHALALAITLGGDIQ